MLYQDLFFLGLLVAHPLPGHVIHKIVEKQQRFFYDLLEPQAVFFQLERLTQAGYLWRDASSLSQGVYQVTEPGRQQFGRLVEDGLSIYTPYAGSLDSSLLLLRYFSQEESLSLLETRRGQLGRAYTRVASLSMRRFPDNEEHQLVYDHLCTLLDAEIDWTDKFIACIVQEEDFYARLIKAPRSESRPDAGKLAPALLAERAQHDILAIAYNVLSVRGVGLSRVDFVLYFLPMLPPERAKQALTRRRETLERLLTLLEEDQHTERDALTRLIHRHRQVMLEVERRWIEGTFARLTAKAGI
ncbi:hypothetical protein EPA93_27680 [Ktedonosporobacter rubrisoli]|uniref:PadR family transcriptional regulator n=1 Tax=Ktedonosporobacter rubrisoli TaxID=2509675 RepID=A0A4P6JVY7_KTERU|nr:hypothetical protein [Ktedonosporobacter rubrisoli]QBD79553.1 hypothetical protein EPA93_27680 [Ktedonosporobacter rubrisoli]